MNKGIKIIGFLLSLLLCHTGSSQQAIAELEKGSIMIGDQVHLRLTLIAPENSQVVFPTIGDTIIAEVEVLKKTPLDTASLEATDEIRYTQELVVTSFDSGYHALPPFVFLFKPEGSDDEYIPLESEALLLEVMNPPINMQADIRDIKAPINTPVSFAEIWYWLVIALGVIATGLLIRYILIKRRRKEPVLPFRKKPVVPPHETALIALDKLKRKKLWQSGKVKEYHSELTEIIRKYIEGRFHIPALEMVTGEIMDKIGDTPIPSSLKENLRKMLELADLVKFAKWEPLPGEQEQSMEYAYDFVRNTILKTEEVTNNDNKDAITEEAKELNNNAV